MVFTNPGFATSMNKLTPFENLYLQSTCGVRPQKRELIIAGGTEIKNPRSVPYAAAMSANDLNNIHARCSASFISSRHLISATHCFFEYPHKKLPCKPPVLRKDFHHLHILYGGTCLRAEGPCPERNVKHAKITKLAALVKFHEGRCQNGHDLSIIEIDEDVEFNENVQPACLPNFHRIQKRHSNRYDYSTLTDVYTAGYGKNKDGVLSPILKGMFSEFQGYYRYKFENDIVNFMPIQPNSVICSGDSGGGVYGYDSSSHREVLVAANSFSDGCLSNGTVPPSRRYSSTSIAHHLFEICDITGICVPGVYPNEK